MPSGFTSRYNAFETPKAPVITQEYLENTLSTDVIFRWLHIPFVIAEIVWDYIDTSNLIAAQMRLSEFKKTTRRIKELKLEYDRARQPYIDGSHQKIEKEHSEALLDEIESDFSTIYKRIYDTVKEEYSDLSDDYRVFVAATYEAYVVYRAILQYNAEFRDFLMKTYNIKSTEVLTRYFVDLKPCFEEYLKGYTAMFNSQVIINAIMEVKQLIKDIVLYDDNGDITPVYDIENIKNNKQTL